MWTQAYSEKGGNCQDLPGELALPLFCPAESLAQEAIGPYAIMVGLSPGSLPGTEFPLDPGQCQQLAPTTLLTQ